MNVMSKTEESGYILSRKKPDMEAKNKGISYKGRGNGGMGKRNLFFLTVIVEIFASLYSVLI